MLYYVLWIVSIKVAAHLSCEIMSSETSYTSGKLTMLELYVKFYEKYKKINMEESLIIILVTKFIAKGRKDQDQKTEYE